MSLKLKAEIIMQRFKNARDNGIEICTQLRHKKIDP